MRQRQGKVPDLRMRIPVVSNGGGVGGGGVTDTLCEIKILNAGVSRYPRGATGEGRKLLTGGRGGSRQSMRGSWLS